MSFWTKLRRGLLDVTTGGLADPAVQDGIKGAFGIANPTDLAAAQDRQIKAQQEAAKLNASNAAQNVVQFDATNPTGTVGTSDVRRKKQMAGSYATGLGLKV